jgi:hypothetical protein
VPVLRDKSVQQSIILLKRPSILLVMSSNIELTPQIVDRLARATPDTLYAEYPNSPQAYAEGYCKITYRDFSNAVNGLAWWLQESLGPGDGSQVLAYIGPNELRYPAHYSSRSKRELVKVFGGRIRHTTCENEGIQRFIGGSKRPTGVAGSFSMTA